jgi:outer membrane immunogenic protein
METSNPTWQQLGSPGSVTPGTLKGSSVIGGGQAGYNWQQGVVVYGVEASFDARHKTATTNIVLPDVIDQINMSQTENWFGTVRGRVGVTFGNALFYGTGGVAFGEVGHSYQEIRVTVPGQSRMISDTVTKAGFTAGAGIEYKVTKNISIGVEYLYIDLGTDTLSSPTSVAGGLTFPASMAGPFKDRSNEVTAKLNWHLN